MPSWERKRQPDDVPTPVAIAVSDFCRRAGAPASPQAVRSALSALSEAEDFRVRLVTDAEPAARPLGPYAVVDLARGTPLDTAALRQRSGYYALVEELLGLTGSRQAVPSGATGAEGSAETDPLARGDEARPLPAAAGHEPGPVDETAGAPEPSSRLSTVPERIAPRRRQSAAAEGPTQPRGRFTQLDSQPAPFDELYRPEQRESLEGLLRQHGHRLALLRALAHGYAGPRGAEPTLSQLDAVLAHHGLLAQTEARERALVLAEVRQARGALGRVAWGLGLRPLELRALMDRLGLEVEVEELRERFRREALAPAHWTARLDLLGRRKYLQDLGLEPGFTEALRRDLQTHLAGTASAPKERLPTLARHLGVPPELLLRTLQRLGLSPEADASSYPLS
jgi:hypothetical protein